MISCNLVGDISASCPRNHPVCYWNFVATDHNVVPAPQKKTGTVGRWFPCLRCDHHLHSISHAVEICFEPYAYNLPGVVGPNRTSLQNHGRQGISSRKLAPLSERGSAISLENITAVEMAVLVEVVVERSMGGGEFLKGLYIPELRHRALSSWKRLM